MDGRPAVTLGLLRLSIHQFVQHGPNIILPATHRCCWQRTQVLQMRLHQHQQQRQYHVEVTRRAPAPNGQCTEPWRLNMGLVQFTWEASAPQGTPASQKPSSLFTSIETMMASGPPANHKAIGLPRTLLHISQTRSLRARVVAAPPTHHQSPHKPGKVLLQTAPAADQIHKDLHAQGSHLDAAITTAPWH